MSGSFNASVWQQLNSTASTMAPTASSREDRFGGAAAQNATGSTSASSSSSSAVAGSAANSNDVLAAPTSATILGSGVPNETSRSIASMVRAHLTSLLKLDPFLISPDNHSFPICTFRISHSVLRDDFFIFRCWYQTVRAVWIQGTASTCAGKPIRLIGG